MEQGLMNYRAGKLDDAIKVWEKIIVFAPQHQASQKAIQTAFVQLDQSEKDN